MSMLSFRLTNSTFFSVRVATIESKSLVFRAIREILSVITVSPLRTKSIISQNACLPSTDFPLALSIKIFSALFTDISSICLASFCSIVDTLT